MLLAISVVTWAFYRKSHLIILNYSPTLSYHRKTLSPFVSQQRRKYVLSTLGKAAYESLLKTTSYNRLALFAKNKNIIFWGYRTLWISAIAAGVVLDLNPIMVTTILPGLATCLITIHKLFE